MSTQPPGPASPPPPPPRASKRKRRNTLYLILFGGIIGPTLFMFGVIGLYVSPWFVEGTRPDGAQPISVQIQQGDSLSEAAVRLKDAGVVTSAGRFGILARIFGGGGTIRAGEYQFYPSDAWGTHMETLTSGRAVQHQVVIPEGMPSVLVRERLMAVESLTGDVAVPAEGSVLPSSYSYERGESRQAVLDRMQEAMRTELARLWAERQPNSVVTSPEQAVNLAAIVEKETGKPSERRMIAGVYSNRIREGMRLQADPTVIYPITQGRPLGRRILRSELDADNGYNTYARAGLPTGPITNPGRESIAAVLNPETTRALYFVADGSGGHVFAETLAEHNANVERWYALRRQRGEM